MKLLGAKTYVVTRQGAGAVVDGDFLAGAISTFPIVGSLQPVTGAELEHLPEGDRTRGKYKLYTTSDLHKARPNAQADTIATPQGDLEVIAVLDFNLSVQGHWKYVLAVPGEDE